MVGGEEGRGTADHFIKFFVSLSTGIDFATLAVDKQTNKQTIGNKQQLLPAGCSLHLSLPR